MSIHKNAYVTALVVVALALLTTMGLRAQTTDVPRLISYQGQVKTSGNSPLSGNHRVTIAFYSDKEGTHQVWQGQYDADVTGGVFNVLLGSGTFPLPDAKTMSQTLYVGVTLDNGIEMRPLSIMAGVPYAMTVPDRSITKEKMATDFVGSISVNGKKITGKGSTLNLTNGENAWLAYDESTGNLSLNSAGHVGDAKTQAIDWALGGNALTGSAGVDWIGSSSTSTGSTEVWVKTNSVTIERFVPAIGTGAEANIIGGSSVNAITGGNSEGNGILSGGANHDPGFGFSPNAIHWGNFNAIAGGGDNIVDTASYSFIGSGYDNDIFSGANFSGVVSGYNCDISIGAQYSFIGSGVGQANGGSYSALVDGQSNRIDAGSHAFLGSGYGNRLGTSGDGSYSFLGGGSGNTLRPRLAVITGGENNELTTSAKYSTINGGQSNVIEDTLSHIGGGRLNYIQSAFSSISAGDTNHIFGSSPNSFIGAGKFNKIKSSLSVIGGGDTNTVETSSSRSVIGGGTNNTVESSDALIGGGESNHVFGNADHASIIGGRNNLDSSSYTVVSGGDNNTINSGADYSVLAGGLQNKVAESSTHSAIGGGRFNRIYAPYNVIAGGDSNLIDRSVNGWNASYSFIGGGLQNVIDSASPYNVVAGGLKNFNGGGASMIGSGARNLIFDNSIEDFIGAGRDNYIGNETRTRLGKGINYSSVVGGDTNVVAANWSSIVGGKWNTVSDVSEYSFIGGGISNTLHGEREVIGGGCMHTIDLHSMYSVIAGGCSNYINDTMAAITGGAHDTILARNGFIGGGGENLIDAFDHVAHTDNNEAEYGTIGGGLGNLITKLPAYQVREGYPVGYVMPLYATISGGEIDTATGHFSMIAGGTQNRAFGFASATLGGVGLRAYDWQTAVGLFNDNRRKPLNNMLNPFLGITLPSADDPIFMVGSGINDAVRTTVFEVTSDGRSAVFKENGSGGATSCIGCPIQSARKGSTYTDNVIYAWAYVSGFGATGAPIVQADFGVSSIIKIRPGVYRVTLNLQDQRTDPPANYTLTDASISVTVVDPTPESDNSTSCGYANVSPINTPGANQFVVRTYDHTSTNCDAFPKPFMFKVVGR